MMMNSLKELMEIGELLGYDDLDIVIRYLTQDELGATAILTVSNALAKKISDVEYRLGFIKANMQMPTNYYYSKYDEKTAANLDMLTRTMMLNLPFAAEHIEWMKEFDVSKIKGCFWHDLAEIINAIQDDDYEPKFFNQYTHWTTIKEQLRNN